MQPVIKKQLPGHHHARVLFVNEDEDVLSVYCSVLYSAKVMGNNKVKHRFKNNKIKNTGIYLLPTEFKGHTVSYEPSF